ncbi:MAG: mechanosensitive ion channel family protein [Tannerella sp.]|jgi:MscS family membrane protein|nr:mechanosensitive ion channel family protein [Tannerella sp.]
MLDSIYYGNSLHDWGISALVIVGALILNAVLKFLIRKVVGKVTKKSKTRIDDIFIEALEKPLFMGIILLAIWVATSRLDFDANVHEAVANSYRILVVLNVTWFFARFIISLMEEHSADKSVRSKKRRIYVDSKILPVIKRSTLIVIWSVGILYALGNVGVNVKALLGTLGIGGIAFALAAQDTIKNIFGGITIFTDRTFSIGDVIKFDGAEGTVVDIGLRSTRIRTYDKQIATIPNYKLTDTLITNITSEPDRRVVMEIGLTYDTSYEKMQHAIEILKSIPEKVHGVSKDDLKAVFTNFGDSAMIITFIYFIHNKSQILETKSEVNFEILKSFNQSALNFAFPTRTVYLSKIDDSPS